LSDEWKLKKLSTATTLSIKWMGLMDEFHNHLRGVLMRRSGQNIQTQALVIKQKQRGESIIISCIGKLSMNTLNIFFKKQKHLSSTK